MINLYLQRCPMVCVPKKEGGHAPWSHNQPRNFCKAKQLDGDGISPVKLNDVLCEGGENGN